MKNVFCFPKYRKMKTIHKIHLIIIIIFLKMFYKIEIFALKDTKNGEKAGF